MIGQLETRKPGQVAAAEMKLRCSKSAIAVGPLRPFHPLTLFLSFLGVLLLDYVVKYLMVAGNCCCVILFSSLLYVLMLDYVVKYLVVAGNIIKG